MVATLLRLRFRVLANTLRRSPLQLAAVVLGVVPALIALAVALLALAGLSAAPAELAQLAIVAGGSLTLLGWLLVPLFLDGVEDTLDPRRLARFPIGPAQQMAAVVVAGFAWVPGGATLLAAIGTSLAWAGRPGPMLAAIAVGVVAAVTCLAGARAVTGLAGTLLGGGGLARAAAVALVLALLAAPAVPAFAAARRDDPISAAQAVVDALGWSPLGAVWSVPGRVAAGDGAGAVAATGIAALTLAGALLLWRSALRAAAESATAAPHSTRRRGLGPLAWVPTGTAGAVGGRALLYWFRDARRARQLLLVPAVPAAMLLWWRLLDADAIALAIGPVVAALLPLSAFADLSYDGTAFASQLAAGIRGGQDRAGRAVALLAVGGPTIVGVQVAVALIAGRGDDLPALLGLSAGVLLTATGVAAVSSALVVVPVPRAGRNPFSAPAGAVTLSVVASYAVLGATILAAAPALVPGIVSLSTRSAAWGWATLAIGTLWGAAMLTTGVAAGGRILERTAPALLSRMRADRGQ